MIYRLLTILMFGLIPLTASSQNVEEVDSLLLQDRFQYYFLEAECQQEKGNYAGSFDLLRQCLKMNPNSAEVWYLLSKYYYNLKEAGKSKEAMIRAGELAPGNAYYQEMIAEYCIQDKEYQRAITAYEQIYNNDHERGDVLEKLVKLGTISENYDKAIWALNKLEILDGKSERLSMTKYQIYLQQKKDKEALDELQLLANTYFNDLNYQVLLGDYYAQHDRKEEALAIYDSVLIKEPLNISAQMSRYSYYLANNEKENSYRQMRDMLSNSSIKPETKVQLLRWTISENNKENKDSTEILQLFRSVFSNSKQDAIVHLVYAYYMQSIQMPEDSIRPVFEEILQLEPDNNDARVQLISYAWDQKDYDKVISLCHEARQYQPDEMLYYYYEGISNYQKKNNDVAIDIFQRGLSTITKESNADIVSDFYTLLGDLYYQEGKKKAAYAAYDSCLQWKEDNIGCLNNYAYYLSLEEKELDKAEKMSYKTIKAEPENSTYLDTYAWILFKLKRYAEAEIYIDKAMEHMDTITVNAEILLHAGDIYYHNDDVDGAVSLWMKAQELLPNDKILAKKIRYRKYFTK